MDKVDAKEEIDNLFQGLADVEHFIGFVQMPGPNGDPHRMAFVRMIFKEDGPFRPWPEKLVYKRSIEVGTGVQMFSIYPPGEFMEAFVATEWEDSYQHFVDAANETGIFIIEVVTPKRKLAAMVVGGVVKNTMEKEITPEDYATLQQCYRAPPGPTKDDQS